MNGWIRQKYVYVPGGRLVGVDQVDVTGGGHTLGAELARIERDVGVGDRVGDSSRLRQALHTVIECQMPGPTRQSRR